MFIRIAGFCAIPLKKAKPMIFLKEYLNKNRIIFLDTLNIIDKNETLEKMIETVRDEPVIKDFEKFKEAVYKREEILSTGIGKNVAIPHVKIDEIGSFFIVIGIHKEGVDWNSLDNFPVKIVFLIGGPDDHFLYLRILAKLTLLIKNDRTRDTIVNASSADEVLEIFKSF